MKKKKIGGGQSTPLQPGSGGKKKRGYTIRVRSGGKRGGGEGEKKGRREMGKDPFSNTDNKRPSKMGIERWSGKVGKKRKLAVYHFPWDKGRESDFGFIVAKKKRNTTAKNPKMKAKRN